MKVWHVLAGLCLVVLIGVGVFVWPGPAIVRNTRSLVAQASQPTPTPTMAMLTATSTRMPTSTMAPTMTQVPATSTPMQTPTMMLTPSATASATVMGTSVPTVTPTATTSEVQVLQTQVAKLSAQLSAMNGVTTAGTITGTGTITSTAVITMGAWSITVYPSATQLMRDFVFWDPDKTWAKFPNEDWPARGFLAKNGLEYGQELSSYCQQDQRCDIVVAARSYRSITADYKVDGIGECKESGGIGCALLLFNVGDVSAMLRDQHVDMGHTITGLYWNGDENDQAISALASHIAYRMIGIPFGNPANPGANCSVPGGCKGADITFAILSGNKLLVRGHTVAR